MQALGRRYVRYFNQRHGRTGTLWEGRYRSSLIDSERYFLSCSRYIETNPVRASLVRTPEEYHWSSFRSNAEGQPDVLLQRHEVYLALGRSVSAQREAYRALFDTPIDAGILDAIRRATNSGIVLGSDDSRASRFRAWVRPRSRAIHGVGRGRREAH